MRPEILGPRPGTLVVLLLLVGPGIPATAQEPPEPLTLEAALQFARLPHPDLDRQHALVRQGLAGVTAARASYGLYADVSLIPRWSDPAVEPGHDLVNDSRASLMLRKRLYDFGRTRALLEATEAQVRSNQYQLFDAYQQRHLLILERFLAVLLADLKFLADDEEMSLRYVRFDKARERQQLGMVADARVLVLESAYREALSIRTASEAGQRYTRVQLALAMNRPDHTPAELTRPAFADLERGTPEYQNLLEQLLQSNPLLAQTRAAEQAAERSLRAARALRRPELISEAEVTYLEREIGSRDEGRVELQLNFPLYQGGIERAAVARADAVLQQRRAEARQLEFALRQELLRLLQDLDELRVERQTSRVREESGDYAVDRARGEYELELRTDLGTTMARLTRAQYLSARAEFNTALTWARLEGLLGRLATPVSATP